MPLCTACIPPAFRLTSTHPPAHTCPTPTMQSMPAEEKQRIVNDVISELGLESTRNTYIGTVRRLGVLRDVHGPLNGYEAML